MHRTMIALAAAVLPATLGAQRSFGSSNGGTPACPAKGSAGAPPMSIGGSMPATQASAFLAQVRKEAIAQESAEGARALTANLATAARNGHTTSLGFGLYLSNYQNAAVAAFADAAAAGGSASPAMRATAWSNLGASLDAAGRRSEAATAFTQAIALGGRRYPSVMGLAVALANGGNLDGAVPLLQEATRLAPVQSEPWLALANVLSCQGKSAGALAAARSAQAADWDADEQERIDRAERNSKQNAEDDPNAPVPMPPGSSPFAGYGRRQQGPQLATPRVPADIATYASDAPRRLAEQLAYSAEANAHLARAENDDDSEGSATSAPGGQSAALVVAMRYRNDYMAKRAAGDVLTRSSAKLELAGNEFSDVQQRLLAEAMEKQRPIDETSSRCEAAATTNSNASTRCKEQRCRALNDMNQALQQEWRGAYNTLYGAYATAAARYDKAMRAWIDYATSPGVQYSLDQERRGNLAKLQSDAYSQINTGFGPACSQAATGAGDAPPPDTTGGEKAGPCRKLKLVHAGKVGDIEMDCHELTWQPEVDLPLSLGLTIHLVRATKNQPGSLYIGAGWDVDAGVGSGSAGAGFKMTWDANGLVTGSGGIAQASLSVDPEIAAEVAEATGRAVSKSVTLQGGYDLVNHTAFGGAY